MLRSYFSLSSDRSTARPQPSTLVPNLKLPLKETPSPSYPRLALTFDTCRSTSNYRFLGPAASHCGLTLSEVSTPASNVPRPSRGSSLSSASTERTLPGSPARATHTAQPPEVTSRWSSSETSTSYAEAIINLQRNVPYVRRISQDMHPASPDRLHIIMIIFSLGIMMCLCRSPVTVRRADSKGKVITPSTSSPEKSPAKLPPRNPRRSPSKRSGSSADAKTSSRHSSSSPEKTRSKGQIEDSFLDREKSSSPSPVRSAAPVPVLPSPSHSVDYSSSFGSPPVSSSSSHASPVKSPIKSDGSVKLKIEKTSSQSPVIAIKSPNSNASSCRDKEVEPIPLKIDPKPESPLSSIHTEEELSEASGS